MIVDPFPIRISIHLNLSTKNKNNSKHSKASGKKIGKNIFSAHESQGILPMSGPKLLTGLIFREIPFFKRDLWTDLYVTIPKWFVGLIKTNPKDVTKTKQTGFLGTPKIPNPRPEPENGWWNKDRFISDLWGAKKNLRWFTSRSTSRGFLAKNGIVIVTIVISELRWNN